MKRLSIIAVTLVLAGMVFGIGFETTFAATPIEDAAHEQVAAETDDAAVTTDEHTTEEAEPGVVGMFGINWKLFVAQLINFTIVLFVLWKFVWKPVTSGLSDRTEKIEQSLQEAQKIAEDRQTFDSWKQGEISTVRTEASAIITAAKQQAEQLKAETVKATADEQNRVIEQAQKRLEQEKASMLESAKAELADIVVQATSAILKEKLDPKKDKQLIDNALKSAQSPRN